MKQLRVHLARLIVVVDRLVDRVFAPECPYCRQSPDECRCDPYWRYGGV